MPLSGLPKNSGVSCATCHLPREIHKNDGKKIITTQHNQNDNLRPNEKMLRSVCMYCHGLGFSIDALADTRLVNTNFVGKPSRHVQSLDMAKRHLSVKRKKGKGGGSSKEKI